MGIAEGDSGCDGSGRSRSLKRWGVRPRWSIRASDKVVVMEEEEMGEGGGKGMGCEENRVE